MRKYNLYISWVLACLGMLGSLFYSIVFQDEPCTLCWYQRICLFPLSIVLGIAAYKNFAGIKIYMLPQLIIGMIVAVYQVILQEVPGLSIAICGGKISCSDKTFLLGPITMPMGSVCLFLLLIILLLKARSYVSLE